MPSHNGHVATTPSGRLEALKIKHKKLSNKIEVEQNHYLLNDAEIRALKLQKLRVKEEIEGIKEAS